MGQPVAHASYHHLTALGAIGYVGELGSLENWFWIGLLITGSGMTASVFEPFDLHWFLSGSYGPSEWSQAVLFPRLEEHYVK
jgi:hypothetical protein